MGKNSQLPQPGDVLAERYRIEEQIGKGGFGVVYRAQQLGMDRTVAVKTLLPSALHHLNAGERFRREAMLARDLNHPNTIRLYDFGQDQDGLMYIAMEYLDGEPLSRLMAREGPLSAERVQHITLQILKSLSEAHEHGVIHRDLKPGNIFICKVHGEEDFVKVLDFGIAKVYGATTEDITGTGQGFGTARYMAPEQIRGKDICAGTDLYGLGIMMTEALSGTKVFASDSSVEVAVAQLSPEPVPIPDVVLQGPLGLIIQRATEKGLEYRYETALDMLEELRAVPLQPNAQTRPLAESQEAEREIAWRRGRNRRRLWVLGAAAFGLALMSTMLVGGFALWSMLEDKAVPPAGATPPVPSPSVVVVAPVAASAHKISIVTQPEGANVYDGEEFLGMTPVVVELPVQEKPRDLLLQLEGFQRTVLQVSLDRDREYRVEMQVEDTGDSTAPTTDPNEEPATQKALPHAKASRPASALDKLKVRKAPAGPPKGHRSNTKPHNKGVKKGPVKKPKGSIVIPRL